MTPMNDPDVVLLEFIRDMARLRGYCPEDNRTLTRDLYFTREWIEAHGLGDTIELQVRNAGDPIIGPVSSEGAGRGWDARFVAGVARGLARYHRISRMEQFAFRLVVVCRDLDALGLSFDDLGFRFVGSVEHINDNRNDGPFDYRTHVHKVYAKAEVLERY